MFPGGINTNSLVTRETSGVHGVQTENDTACDHILHLMFGSGP